MMGRRISAWLLAASLASVLLPAGVVHAQQAAPAADAANAASAAVISPAPVRPAPQPAAPVQPFTGAAAGSLLQTIFALCIVLGLLAVLAWALKRYGPKAAGGSAHIRMVGGLNLGGRERIIVVEVGDQ